MNTNNFHSSSLINAKIGKNNVKSRRDSNDAPYGLSSLTNQNNAKNEDKKENLVRDKKEMMTNQNQQ